MKGLVKASYLRERIDFWEDTIYGHGGDAKIWAGLKYGNTLHYTVLEELDSDQSVIG